MGGLVVVLTSRSRGTGGDDKESGRRGHVVRKLDLEKAKVGVGPRGEV